MPLDQASQSREKKPGVQWKTCGSFFGVLLCFVFSGCETINGLSCGGGGQRAVQELVYFGTDTPSGSVTPEAWAQFLSETVTPRFPHGLSAWQASGQWRSASGQIIYEPSYVLSLIHPDHAPQNKAVHEIVASYKTRFRQEAVLRVTTPVCTSL
jgi:Protein of unknown function (DUF3574)